MSSKIRDILVTIRDFLFSTFNKEFLIFLFFLILSSAYWLMSVLNDTMEREIEIPVQLTNVPQNVMVIGDSSITVRAVVRDKGYAFFTYFHGDRILPIKVPFPNYAKSSDKVTVTQAELQKMVREQLYGSTKIISLKPANLEIEYNYGLRKLIPVQLLGKVKTSGNYYLTRVQFSPESVYVYSSQHILDSIKVAHTVHQDMLDVTDTVTQVVRLKHLKGVKMLPSKVKMTLYTDIMTEAETVVPVTPAHVPVGTILRTFPTQVTVRYVVGASQFKNVNESDFMVEADYSSTGNGTTSKCQLRLVKSPKVVRNPMLMTTEADYLIEQ